MTKLLDFILILSSFSSDLKFVFLTYYKLYKYITKKINDYSRIHRHIKNNL